MRTLALFLFFTASVLAQIPNGAEPAAAAHKGLQPKVHYGAMAEVTMPRYRGVGSKTWAIVHIKLPQGRGLRDPMFCWVDDFTDHGSVQVLKLTPQEIVIKAKRGHVIDWTVGHR